MKNTELEYFNNAYNELFKKTKREPQIVYSALQTPDRTVIESENRHDCKFHKDKITGKTYMIDGGHDYIRHSSNGDGKLITIYSDDNFELVRKYAFRKSSGKDGKLYPAKTIRIKDMSDDYLINSLEYIEATIDRSYTTINSTHYNILLTELGYRLVNNIKVLEQ